MQSSSQQPLDLIIANGRYFDGSGGPSQRRHVGVSGGRVVAVSQEPLTPGPNTQVVDATGQWVMPGFVDIHTHYDAELLAAPGLSESVRHGVTTVMIGSCSLGTVYSSPQDSADMFSRVEALPHDIVLSLLEENQTWSTPAEYIAALENQALGPNVASLLGHSDIRAAVMGLGRSTDENVVPTESEFNQMEQMLSAALDAGFVGISEQRNPWDRLAGDRYRSRTLPSTYAKWKEYRRLHKIIRRRRKVVQSIPNLTQPLDIVPYLLSSMRWGKGRELKVSFLTAADPKSNPYTSKVFHPLARLANVVGKGNFRWQHVPSPFKVYADGVDLVVFEEFGAGAAALHLKDHGERYALIGSAEYRKRFREDLENKWSPRVWNRRLDEVHIVDAPDPSVIGKTVAEVAATRTTDPIDTFLDLLIEHGQDLRWWSVISNDRPDVHDKLSSLPDIQIGFADSGAHLRNMAFYNFALYFLYRAHSRGFMTMERAVHRVTGELADWFDLDAGHIRVGDRADIVVVNPSGLTDAVTEHHESTVEEYGGLSRVVNRNPDAVSAVFIAGNCVVVDGAPTPTLGERRTGRFLRAGEHRGQVDPETQTVDPGSRTDAGILAG